MGAICWEGHPCTETSGRRWRVWIRAVDGWTAAVLGLGSSMRRIGAMSWCDFVCLSPIFYLCDCVLCLSAANNDVNRRNRGCWWMDWNPCAKLNECTIVSSLSVFCDHSVLCDAFSVVWCGVVWIECDGFVVWTRIAALFLDSDPISLNVDQSVI